MTMAAGPVREQLREQLLVGISVSEPAEGELIGLGLSQVHVRHAFIEIARHLLAAGYSLAYGGDFRQQGYTEAMLDLVRTYSRDDQPGPERIRVYSAWPRWLGLGADERAELVSVATLVPVDRPPGAPEHLAPETDRAIGDRLWAALALTEMRREMNRDIDARVLLGGRSSGQEGLLPGVVEEAALAVDDGLPLFVVGGFGGAASLVGSDLAGEARPELSLNYQKDNTPGYASLWEAAQGSSVEPNFEDLVEKLARIGAGVNRNGLSSEQNDMLLESSDIDEIIALVLRGLKTMTKT